MIHPRPSFLGQTLDLLQSNDGSLVKREGWKFWDPHVNWLLVGLEYTPPISEMFFSCILAMLQEKQSIIIATKQISPATRTGWLQPSSTYKNLRGTLITKLPRAASWNSGIPKWIGLWYPFFFRNLELSVWSSDFLSSCCKNGYQSNKTNTQPCISVVRVCTATKR